ncbi:hypothetical protein KAJ87_03690 [Candidatus Pacearchaeota archaeon]|nr:hypothetical protein [Candidatus Pacearchaeota archaeon]
MGYKKENKLKRILREKREEEIWARDIAWHYKINLSEVKKFRKISLDKSVEKFLSKEDFGEIVEKGHYKKLGKNASVTEQLIQAIKRVDVEDSLESYFIKTEEGRKWYYSNHPNPRVCQNVVEKLHSNILDYNKSYGV